MPENDQWDTDLATGDLLVSRLSSRASAAAPDGSMALLRITLVEGDNYDASAFEFGLRSPHVRDLTNAQTEAKATLVARAKPAGSA